MAAVAELSLLLFALISNIHTEELIVIKMSWDDYTFNLPKEASSCLISRFVGEEKLVLWNTSDLWSENPLVPEDLKQRLSVVSRENITSYRISSLTDSDSGSYQQECWTNSEVTYKKNISIIICDITFKPISVSLKFGQTLDVACKGIFDGLDILWLKRDFKYEQAIWTKDLGDKITSVKVTNTSTLHASKDRLFTCLRMNHQQCVSSQPVEIPLAEDIIYRSVEETAVLPCTINNFTDGQPPSWESFPSQQQNQTMDQNYSLVLSSLTLNHTGAYECQTSKGLQVYMLVVCPKFGQPVVELFSEGEEFTLTCKDWDKGVAFVWFIKSDQTEGRTSSVTSDLNMSRVSWSPDGTLHISNVSVTDAGEYWCAVVDKQCLSPTKILLMYREPFGIYSTFYTVRCSVLSILLVMLCVVVVAVMLKTRRGEQL